MKKTIILIICIFATTILTGCDVYTEPDYDNHVENNETEMKEELDDIYAKNEKINKFLNEYNSLNPATIITKDMISPRNNSIIYIHDTGFRGFEILSKTDNGKEMISIQIEKHTNNSSDFKNIFNSFMKVYVPTISNEKLDELFNNLINGNYTIDYSTNENALKFENVYLSFNDSGAVEVYGQEHFCFIRMYGEYK